MLEDSAREALKARLIFSLLADIASDLSGNLGFPCSLDSTCLGSLYCLDPSGTSTGSCGGSGTNGNGALCDDGCAAGMIFAVSSSLACLCLGPIQATPFAPRTSATETLALALPQTPLALPSAPARAAPTSLSPPAVRAARPPTPPAASLARSVASSASTPTYVFLYLFAISPSFRSSPPAIHVPQLTLYFFQSNIEMCGGCANAGGVECVSCIRVRGVFADRLKPE